MSKIEWTGKTWNPIVGCSRISEGCRHCYAERMAARLAAMGQDKYKGAVDERGRWSGVLWFDAPSHEIPLRVKKPTTWFVNSMSDMFHERQQVNWLMRIWEVMRRANWHTFQILTKRSKLMLQQATLMADIYGLLPNVWLGVSLENQKCADERIPDLCATPAALRFISAEPLLGHVNLGGYCNDGSDWLDHIGWVIVGGESGATATVRPFHLGWATDIIDQCRDYDTRVFIKQLGAVATIGAPPRPYPTKARKGNDPAEWPPEIRVREMPEVSRG